MKPFKNLFPALCLFLLIASASCTQQSTTEEKVEITTMDSTAQKAKEVTDKLDEQTKKVEASIEKMDEDFKKNQ